MAKKRKKKNSNKNTPAIILLIVIILLIIVLIAMIQSKKSKPVEEESEMISQEMEESSVEGIETAEPEEQSSQEQITEEIPETEAPQEQSTQTAEPEETAEPENAIDSNASVWVSFDGYTLGNPNNGTYGTIYSADQITALDGTKKGYGQGVNVDENNRPVGAIWLQDDYGKYGALYIGDESKNIYLTFDEGYENGYTEKILDVLKEKDCKGVFFVTMDYAKKNPDLINRMISEGHVVGNHSVRHLSMPTLSLEEASAEITDLHAYIKENFNYDMYLFRPPMGEFSEQTLALTQSLGYRTTLWSYAYKDYDTQNQPDISEARAKVTAAKHDGAIYLLHAVSATNTAILGDVIDDFRNAGYTVGPIPR